MTPLPKRRVLKIGGSEADDVTHKYHLSESEVGKVSRQYKATKQSADPSMKGFYHYLWEALITLGPNKNHSQAAVMSQLKKLIEEAHAVSS